MEQVDYELFEILKELRLTLADQRRCPAYMIFPDKTLLEMASKFPKTREELQTIYGVGKTKLYQYGNDFLSEIIRYIDDKREKGEEIPYEYVSPDVDANGVDNIHVAISPIDRAPIHIENFVEIRDQLDYFLDFYRNAAYTTENMKQAAADKASLNKLKKALKVKEKEIKDICLEPYRRVQQQFKELVAMIDEPLKSISEFTEEMEQVRKDEKCSDIKIFYDGISSELGPFAPDIFSQSWFYDKRWENKTYHDWKWQQEVSSKVREVSASLQDIRESAGLHTAAVMSKYIETGSIIEAKRFLKTLTAIAEEEQKITVESGEKGTDIPFVSDENKTDREGLAVDQVSADKLEVEIYKGETQRDADKTDVGEIPAASQTAPTTAFTPAEAGRLLDVILKLKLTEKQFQQLESYLSLNRLDYEVVLKIG